MSTVVANSAFRTLNIADISSTSFELRSEHSEREIGELSETVRQFGVIQPVLVSFKTSERKYHLIFGGRRLRSVLKLGQKTIPALVIDDIDDNDALVLALILALIENMQREDLESLEVAQGILEMKIRLGYDHEKIARTIGKSELYVRQYLELLELPKEIQERISVGELNTGQAIELTKLSNQPELQSALAEKIVKEDLSVEVTSRFVEEIRKPELTESVQKVRPRYRTRQASIPDERISRELMQVQIRAEKFVTSLGQIPFEDWPTNSIKQLQELVSAFEQDIRRFKNKLIRYTAK